MLNYYTVSPSFTTYPQEATVAVEWTEVRLTCTAVANPVARIEWERDNGEQPSVSATTTFSMSGNIVSPCSVATPQRQVLNLEQYFLAEPQRTDVH